MSANNTANSTPPRRLAAFDFDHTIVDDNTDTAIAGLIDRSKIPPSIQALAKTGGWTQFMQAIFKLLFLADIKPARIKKTIVEINENVGMVQCLKTLRKQNFDLIIISDSNTEFIQDWNEAHDLTHDILQVFTNPAHFDDRGMLVVRPFDHQTECTLSSVNMCKGKILTDFIARRKRADHVDYENVFYVGDGANDICPALRLSAQDYVCMRKDYNMDKRIKEVAAQHNLELRAQAIRWTSGTELLSEILKTIKK